MRAISGETLAPGSIPPSPGLAPCESLISSATTGARATHSSSAPRSKFPPRSRQPKYPVPIWKTRSPPCRWWSEIPPSPVFCQQDAPAAPRLSASIARPDSAPKLIPLMFTALGGRIARARPWAAPRTFGPGRRNSGADPTVPGSGFGCARAACLTIR